MAEFQEQGNQAPPAERTAEWYKQQADLSNKALEAKRAADDELLQRSYDVDSAADRLEAQAKANCWKAYAVPAFIGVLGGFAIGWIFRRGQRNAR